MEVRSLRLPDDLDGLSRLTIASSSSTVLEIVTTASGFELTEAPVSAPSTKDHAFLAETTSVDRLWTEGYVVLDGQSILGFAATAYQRWNRRQLLCHLYVDAAHRGRGLARVSGGAQGARRTSG